MDSKRSAVTVCGVGQYNRGSKKVKLCGYLKKKRNKVGGWRKMWFVLQDKLLLSYASKEEYDNKLVSFKDVLNLVPGTQVRPLGGFRFTIETTTHVMYTFHCDDRNAYREWITMLLDSLAAGSPKAAAAAAAISGACSLTQRLYNNSVDNIPHALWCNAALNSPRQRELSSSCDSVRQHTDLTAASASGNANARREYVERLRPARPTAAAATGGVRLPIARSTAKLLERNGVNSCDSQQKQLKKKLTQQRVQQQQQVECCNGSSGAPTITHDAGVPVSAGARRVEVDAEHYAPSDSVVHFRLHHQQGNTKPTSSNNGETMGDRQLPLSTEGNTATYQVNQAVLAINSMFQQTQRHHDLNRPVATQMTLSETRPICDRTEISMYAKEDDIALECLCGGDTNTSCCSCCTKDGESLLMVKEQIQRLNIKGWKESQLQANSGTVNRNERSRIVTTKHTEANSMSMATQLDDKTTVSNGNIVADKSTSTLEPIYAVVDLAHKYAQRKMRRRSEELNRCRSYESILNGAECETTTGSDSEKCKIFEKSYKNMTEDDIDGIYEDGDKFTTNYATLDLSEDENIYEPINVSATQPNSFWKYFTRLKVNSILQFTRMRKGSRVDYDTIRIPSSNLPAEAILPPASTASPSLSQLSGIKHKFGAHRKSMQVRVRKLCARTHDPTPAYKLQPKPQLQHQQAQVQNNSNGHHNGGGAINVGKKTKYRWKSVKIRPKQTNAEESVKSGKQRFFGSLPHLRKARLSIFSSHNLESIKDRNGNLNNLMEASNSKCVNSNE